VARIGRRFADAIRPKLDEKEDSPSMLPAPPGNASIKRNGASARRLRRLLAPEGTMWIVAGRSASSRSSGTGAGSRRADALRRVAPESPEREQARFDAADAALNPEYRALREAMGPGNRQVLQLAQREWIRYRDAEAASGRTSQRRDHTSGRSRRPC
jgi:uncharacterized protein YecT (DUF1311 family)